MTRLAACSGLLLPCSDWETLIGRDFMGFAKTYSRADRQADRKIELKGHISQSKHFWFSRQPNAQIILPLKVRLI